MISYLLSLINIGSTTAFNDVISLTIETLYASYLICCLLLLGRRLRGDIMPLDNEKTPIVAEGIGELTLCWGKWHFRSWLGIANNMLAVTFLVILIFFNFWPATNPTSAVVMNYSVVVVGAIVIFRTLYYVGWARHFYAGPLRDLNF